MKLPMTREARLLLLTIVVSTLVLLALARLRFPQTPIVDIGAQPLQRLASRASYEALAANIEGVEPIIAPSLVVLRVEPRLGSSPRAIADLLVRRQLPEDPRHVAALRTDAATALASLAPDARVVGIVGGAQGDRTATVLATDAIRRIARVRVPEAPARELTVLALEALRTPVYVVAVEGTQAGVTLRPVFLGRGDRFGSARWARPLLPLGGIPVEPGALLFSLDGEFVGSVVVEDGAPAIADARDVLGSVARLAAAPSAVPSTAGVAVQLLTPELASATGAPRGVVVSDVDPGGPASGILQAADVITAIDGQAVDSPERFLLHVASQPAGKPASITFVRMGQSHTAAITLAAHDSHTGADAPSGQVGLAAEPGIGTRVVAVPANTPLDAAGLRGGDLVTRAGDVAAPTPAQLRRVLGEGAPAGVVILTVRRDGRQHVMAARVSRPADASQE